MRSAPAAVPAASGAPQAAAARMQAVASEKAEAPAPAANGNGNGSHELSNAESVAANNSGEVASAATVGEGITQEEADSIKAAIRAQEKFLGELIEHVSRWEMSGGEMRLFFPTEHRALADLLQQREPMERLRNISNRILGRAVRVCVKLDAAPSPGTAARSGTRELRAKFEQDPMVRAMMERFGGQISDVKRRGEE